MDWRASWDPKTLPAKEHQSSREAARKYGIGTKVVAANGCGAPEQRFCNHLMIVWWKVKTRMVEWVKCLSFFMTSLSKTAKSPHLQTKWFVACGYFLFKSRYIVRLGLLGTINHQAKCCRGGQDDEDRRLQRKRRKRERKQGKKTSWLQRLFVISELRDENGWLGLTKNNTASPFWREDRSSSNFSFRFVDYFYAKWWCGRWSIPARFIKQANLKIETDENRINVENRICSSIWSPGHPQCSRYNGS